MTDKNDLRDMTRSFLEEIFQGAVEEEDANDSLLVEGPHGSYGHAMAGGKDQYNNYRQQHVAELADIVEQYPDMAESETDLREYWEGIVRDALKLAFGGSQHEEMPMLQRMVLNPPGEKG
jgi:hypothetical protein